MKNFILIILVLLLIPNIFFLALQLSRENDEINRWNSEISESGLWISPKHPAVSGINTISSYAGIVTSFSEDYSQLELSDLEIVSGDLEDRDFNLIKITADSNNTKYYISPSDAEVDEYLKSLLAELGDEGFLVSDARENAFNILRKELTKEEFTNQTKLGKFAEIIISKDLNSDKTNINSIAIRK